MNKKEKPSQEIVLKDFPEINLNLNEFYKALSEAIKTNNIRTVYDLSKIFTRHSFKKINN